MSKKLLFLIVVINLFGVANIAKSEIVPVKKPQQSKEVTDKKLLIDILKPIAKPIKKKKIKQVEEKIVVKKEKKKYLILPKKKPLIAGSEKISEIKISKYYNKKDFNLAKKAISEMKKAKWPEALKTSKKAKDKSI